ncbi:hypothetical protein PV-S19_0027 [Pacmanvirus S19]|nr:hypothetical protein PV-S19_0027 [Pacmanvirus S19]
MSSLIIEDIITTAPAGSNIGVKIDQLTLSEILVGTISEVTNGSGVNINGESVSFNNTTKFFTSETITTGDATPVTLYTMTTIADAAYFIIAEIIAVNTTDNETAAFKKSIKIKNVSGSVTASSDFDTWSITDTSLGTASISFNISGTDIQLNVTGVIGKSIKWAGEVKQITTSF